MKPTHTLPPRIRSSVHITTPLAVLFTIWTVTVIISMVTAHWHHPLLLLLRLWLAPHWHLPVIVAIQILSRTLNIITHMVTTIIILDLEAWAHYYIDVIEQLQALVNKYNIFLLNQNNLMEDSPPFFFHSRYGEMTWITSGGDACHSELKMFPNCVVTLMWSDKRWVWSICEVMLVCSPHWNSSKNPPPSVVLAQLGLKAAGKAWPFSVSTFEIWSLSHAGQLGLAQPAALHTYSIPIYQMPKKNEDFK